MEVGQDTIAAIATPPGRGGIGIVRVSGTLARDIALAVVGALPRPRHATKARFKDADGSVIDEGLALYFPAPRSFTGEDVLELHGHGGVVVMDRLLARVCAAGARIARPGEFTERAFLNDRMDLAQAEAVADLIDAGSRRAARAAMRSLSGEFSARVAELDQAVLDLRVYIEAAIDFAEEELDFLADGEIRACVAAIAESIDSLLADCRQGAVLRDGFDVVIAGPPNVGKSSLMNRLLAENRAIVTDIPGTTRDLLFADVEVGGVPVRLTDTAGLRSDVGTVEAIGIERARAAAAQADLVLAVSDDRSRGRGDESLGGIAADRVLPVANKVDLSGGEPGRGADGAVRISALTGAGLQSLRNAIVERAGVLPGEGAYLARQRHLDALAVAAKHVAEAERQVSAGFGDLAAEELREAQARLGDITGPTSVDDLLGEIFASFCIGK